MTTVYTIKADLKTESWSGSDWDVSEDAGLKKDIMEKKF